MANATVQSRIKPELKKQAEELFSAIGISVSDAIRLFLQQSVNEGGLPFRPRAKQQPNDETIEAISEIEQGGGKKYNSSQEMYDDLDI